MYSHLHHACGAIRHRKVRQPILVVVMAILASIGLAACGGGGGSGGTNSPSTAPSANTLSAPDTQVQQTGESYTLSVTTTASGLTYQWQRSVDGGTTWTNQGTTFTAPSSFGFAADDLSMNGYQFRLFVTDGTHTGASVPYTLSVTASAPTIQAQPQDRSVILGANAVFSVSATGASRSYQWQMSTDLTNWQNVSSTTNALTVTNPTALDNGHHYRVLVTTSLGSVTSAVATLTVQSPIANAYILHQDSRLVTRLSVMFDGTTSLALTGMNPEAVTLSETPINATLSPIGDTLMVNSGLTFTALQFNTNGALVDRWGAKPHTRSGPFGFAFSPDGQGIYAITGANDIGQYQLTLSGVQALTPSWSSSQPGVGGFVGPNGNWLMTAEASTGKLTTYAINSDRTLSATPLASSAVLGSLRWITSNAAGTRAYVQLYGGSIAQVNVDAAGNVSSMTPATISGGGTGRPVLSSDGKCLFAASYSAPYYNAGNIASFQIAGDGTLSHSTPASLTTNQGLTGIAVTPDSRYLVAVHDGTGSSNGQFGSGYAMIYGIGTQCELTWIGLDSTGSSKPAAIVIR